ncbi:ABC transporter ATP-binding protein [Paenibacillus mesophilus]|uniref:ABC transporter transmembrane domain-containing protein n=1 Tax=Paenibacillus mesophilus TaxID=2582849 RepID=UPI00110D9F25|nr:ABC transporter ATP-binding protein [Paenibacillus mesophilus]TMV50116.1 ABC transporter ATP-binding protein [Paenibacillus mesophilus]
MDNWKWVRHRVFRMKRYYLFILVLMAIEAAVNLSGIGVQKLIIDNVFVQGMYGQLPVVIGLYGAVVLLDAVLFTGIRTLMFSYKAKIRHQLISDFMNRFYRIPFKLYRDGRNADNVQLLTKDVDGISNLLGQRLPEGAQTIVKMLLLVGTIGLTSPSLLLIVAAVSPVYIYLTRYYGTKLKEAAKLKSERRSAMLVHLEEGISASREIAAFNRQEREMKRYHHLFRSYYEQAALETRLTNRQVVWSGPLKWGVNLIVLAYLGHGVLHHTISLGTFVVVYQFASQLIDSISGCYSFAVGLSGSIATVERYREFGGFEPIEPGSRKLMEPIRSVELESVAFKYADEGGACAEGTVSLAPDGKKNRLRRGKRKRQIDDRPAARQIVRTDRRTAARQWVSDRTA